MKVTQVSSPTWTRVGRQPVAGLQRPVGETPADHARYGRLHRLVVQVAFCRLLIRWACPTDQSISTGTGNVAAQPANPPPRGAGNPRRPGRSAARPRRRKINATENQPAKPEPANAADLTADRG